MIDKNKIIIKNTMNLGWKLILVPILSFFIWRTISTLRIFLLWLFSVRPDIYQPFLHYNMHPLLLIVMPWNMLGLVAIPFFLRTFLGKICISINDKNELLIFSFIAGFCYNKEIINCNEILNIEYSYEKKIFLITLNSKVLRIGMGISRTNADKVFNVLPKTIKTSIKV